MYYMASCKRQTLEYKLHLLTAGSTAACESPDQAELSATFL